MQNHPVRLLDKDGRFVRLVSSEDAQELNQRGLATLGGKGKKAWAHLLRHSIEDHSGPANYTGGTLSTHYTERFNTVAPMAMLKRLVNGSFVEWENGLTFDDLRNGPVANALSMARRKSGARAMASGASA